MQVAQYQIVDHICRVCFSRVLMRDVDGSPEFRCGNCGETGESVARSICCCGVALPGSTSKKDQVVDVGVRCTLNLYKSPEFPAEIVAKVMSEGTRMA